MDLGHSFLTLLVLIFATIAVVSILTIFFPDDFCYYDYVKMPWCFRLTNMRDTIDRIGWENWEYQQQNDNLGEDILRLNRTLLELNETNNALQTRLKDCNDENREYSEQVSSLKDNLENANRTVEELKDCPNELVVCDEQLKACSENKPGFVERTTDKLIKNINLTELCLVKFEDLIKLELCY